jgi:hypothetical protein
MGAAVGPGRSSPFIHRDGCDRLTPTNAASCAPPTISTKYRTREADNGSSAATRVDARAAVALLVVAAINPIVPNTVVGQQHEPTWSPTSCPYCHDLHRRASLIGGAIR